MNFIVSLPRTSRGYNSIWVIVERLTKPTHFIPVSTTYWVSQYAELYISHIVHYDAYRRPSSPIEDLYLLLAFENNYMNVWTPISSEAQSIILRLMNKLSGSIKSSRTCFVLVL
jgi:hypothetical protein